MILASRIKALAPRIYKFDYEHIQPLRSLWLLERLTIYLLSSCNADQLRTEEAHGNLDTEITILVGRVGRCDED